MGLPINEAIVNASETAAFIYDNFSLFQANMCKVCPSFSSFNASSIEKTSPVHILEKNENGVLLDFDSDNGFALVGQNYEIFNFSPTGEPPKINDEDCCYSIEYGWGRLFQDSFFPFEKRKGSDENDGNHLAGGGISSLIYSPDDYVKKNKGDGFTITLAHSKKDWSFHCQREFSIYARYAEPTTKEYEGNCQIASLYEACEYLLKECLSGEYSCLVNSDPESDPFYNDFMAKKDKNGNSVYVISHHKVPLLYKHLRDWYRDNDSYQFDYTHVEKCQESISAISTWLNEPIFCLSSTDCSDQDVDKAVVAQNQVCVIWVNGDDNLSHAMPVVGKRTYSKIEGWWVFQHTEYFSLLAVNDNIHYTVTYVDPSITKITYFANVKIS